MAQALGGYVSEQVFFGIPTTGAHDDISKVTQIAKEMVTKWGMSEKLGTRTFGKRESMVFLGRDIAEQRDYSEKTAEEIDEEVRLLVDEAKSQCEKVILENKDKLILLAERLIEVETIEAESLTELLGETDTNIEKKTDSQDLASNKMIENSDSKDKPQGKIELNPSGPTID